MSRISTKRDIAASAKIRAETEAEHSIKERFFIKKRRIITSMAAAAAAVVIVGGTVYAVSPDVKEAVNNILGINRQSAEEFYEIQNAYGSSAASLDAIEEGVIITENDFTEFAEGIRVKPVSIMNSGTFVDIILEFELDEPEKAAYYSIGSLNIKLPEEMVGSYSYGSGSLTVSDNGRIYEHISLSAGETIPEGTAVALELASMQDLSDGIPAEKTVEGYYRTDFVIGSPVKSYSANIKPTEISWTQPNMGNTVAKMELSGLEYSPKNIRVDLRMIEDCLVDYEFDPEAKYGTANYLNSTEMFFDGGNGKGSDFDPIKFKMSDGTIKDVQYSGVHSDAVMEFDMSAFEQDTPSDDSPTVTTVHSDETTETPSASKNYDRVKWSQDIPNDRPATVTFEFWGIMDYSGVEAIVFCGVDIPITERDFGTD